MFKYAKAKVENGKIVETDIKTVDQKKLTAECWLVRINGLSACKDCELKDTGECGGAEIRKTGRNSKGIKIPIGR